MSDITHRHGQRPSPEIREYVRLLIEQHGPRRAAKRLGIARDAAISIVADLSVLPGTLALVREAQRAELRL